MCMSCLCCVVTFWRCLYVRVCACVCVCVCVCPTSTFRPEIEIESVEELKRIFSAFLRTRGFTQRGAGQCADLLPHVQADTVVIHQWVHQQLVADCALPDVSHPKGRRGPYRRRRHAPFVRSYEDLRQKCGPLLDCVFESAPNVDAATLCAAMVQCHIDMDAQNPPRYVQLCGLSARGPSLGGAPSRCDAGAAPEVPGRLSSASRICGRHAALRPRPRSCYRIGLLEESRSKGHFGPIMRISRGKNNMLS